MRANRYKHKAFKFTEFIKKDSLYRVFCFFDDISNLGELREYIREKYQKEITSVQYVNKEQGYYAFVKF